MQREFTTQANVAPLIVSSALQQKLNQILTPSTANIELPPQKNLSSLLINALCQLNNSNLMQQRQQIPIQHASQYPIYVQQQEPSQPHAIPTSDQCNMIQDHLNNMLLIERSRSQMINTFAQQIINSQLNGLGNHQQIIQNMFSLNYLQNQLNNVSQNIFNKYQPDQRNFPDLLHEQEAENKILKEQINTKNLSACDHIHVNKQQIDTAYRSGTNSSTNNNLDSKVNQANQPANNISQSTLRSEMANDPAAYRKMCIERYKRKRRIWTRQVSYACRKVIAEKRLRVKGRFISKSDQKNICQLLQEENVENVFDEKKNLDLIKFQQRVKLFGNFNTKKISKERILTKINDKAHEKEIQELIINRIIHKKQLLQIIIEPRDK